MSYGRRHAIATGVESKLDSSVKIVLCDTVPLT